jgi:hypothetical protein
LVFKIIDIQNQSNPSSNAPENQSSESVSSEDKLDNKRRERVKKTIDIIEEPLQDIPVNLFTDKSEATSVVKENNTEAASPAIKAHTESQPRADRPQQQKHQHRNFDGQKREHHHNDFQRNRKFENQQTRPQGERPAPSDENGVQHTTPPQHAPHTQQQNANQQNTWLCV